jgi:4-amino-4-deoxy-L-arabinose transferase-like glycosyltransferase
VKGKRLLEGDQGIWLLLLSFAFSVVLRVPHYLHQFTFVDEGWYATTGWMMAEGGVLYSDIWCNHQPIPMLCARAFFLLFGVSSWAIHLGSLSLVMLESALLYLLGRHFFSSAIGGLAALAYALSSTAFYTPRIIGMTAEQPMVVFTTSAVLLFLHGLQTRRFLPLAAAGTLAACAVFSKPAAAPLFPLFLLFTVIRSGRGQGRLLWFLLTGYLLTGCVFLFYLWDSGTLSLWWNQSILSRLIYLGQVETGSFIQQLLWQPLSFGLIYLWAWILIIGGRRGRDQNPEVFRFNVLWLAAAVLGVMIGRRFYANYYIQLFPSISLLVAVGVHEMLRNRIRQRVKVTLGVALVCFLLPFLWFHSRTIAHLYFFFEPDRHEQVELWGMCVIDRELKEIADYIQSITEDEERIFVWGPNPELYFLSRRKLASVYPLFDVTKPGEPPYSPQEEAATLDHLILNPPEVILDTISTEPIDKRAGWHQFLRASYVVDRELHDVRIFRKRKDL